MLPVTGTVQAQAWRSTGDYLRQIDVDGDGRVSRDEYIAWMSYGFDAMDRNRDGVLQASEQPGGRGKPLARITHHANLAERFARQDVDRDGFLSAKELAAPPR
ncbi:MAG: calcium-dependent protein kinase 21 [Xanthomonadaceae bacterium]|nr:calcium-dependent protein kinase 21 [Xanthomonadaceae bacterium]